MVASRKSRAKKSKPGLFAVSLEIQRVWFASVKHTALGIPMRVMKSAIQDPSIHSITDESRILDLVGESILDLFDALGPVYGKAAQIGLSRLSPKMQEVADGLRLTRLYGDWPPLDFSVVAEILDQEIPKWRSSLKVEPRPLGVASMAQVHAAVDEEGSLWVIKIIKPQARQRLSESLAAVEKIINKIDSIAFTLVAKRFVRESRELVNGLYNELDMEREKNTIIKLCEKLKKTNQGVLKLPKVNEEFCTKNILVIERFEGTPLSKIVADHQRVPKPLRQKLAKKILQELLVQVFEVGLFHADPHAGNLILMEDGSVGLFDWGLAGELMESDRRHIAGMLKAVIALDLEQLIEVLQEMATEANKNIPKAKIRKELNKIIKMVKAGEEDPTKKPGLQTMIESCLKAASKLGIPIPTGLLLMAKSLITIEGLAKGIDPNVSMKRIATPVLFRAAKPTFKDFINMSKRLPSIFRKTFE